MEAMLSVDYDARNSVEKSYKIAKLVKTNNDLFLSQAYYKYQCEELLVENHGLISELKLIEKILKDRKTNDATEKERLTQRYESEFQQMNKDSEKQHVFIRELKEQLQAIQKNESTLKEFLNDKEEVIKSKDILIKKIQKVENEMEQCKVNLSETESKQAYDIIKYEELIENLRKKCEYLELTKLENENLKEELSVMRNKLEDSDQIIKLEKSKHEIEVNEFIINHGFELNEITERYEFELAEVNVAHEEKVAEMLKAKDYKIGEQKIYLESLREEFKEISDLLQDKTNMVKFLYQKVKKVEEIAEQRNIWKRKFEQSKCGSDRLRRRENELKKEKRILELQTKTKKKHNVANNAEKVKELENQLKIMHDEKVSLENELEKKKAIRKEHDTVKNKNIELSITIDTYKRKVLSLEKKITEQSAETENKLDIILLQLQAEKEKNKDFEDIQKQLQTWQNKNLVKEDVKKKGEGVCAYVGDFEKDEGENEDRTKEDEETLAYKDDFEKDEDENEDGKKKDKVVPVYEDDFEKDEYRSEDGKKEDEEDEEAPAYEDDFEKYEDGNEYKKDTEQNSDNTNHRDDDYEKEIIDSYSYEFEETQSEAENCEGKGYTSDHFEVEEGQVDKERVGSIEDQYVNDFKDNNPIDLNFLSEDEGEACDESIAEETSDSSEVSNNRCTKSMVIDSDEMKEGLTAPMLKKNKNKTPFYTQNIDSNDESVNKVEDNEQIPTAASKQNETNVSTNTDMFDQPRLEKNKSGINILSLTGAPPLTTLPGLSLSNLALTSLQQPNVASIKTPKKKNKKTKSSMNKKSKHKITAADIFGHTPIADDDDDLNADIDAILGIL